MNISAPTFLFHYNSREIRGSFFLRFPIITDKFHKRSYLFFFLSFIDAKNIVSRRLATRISEEEGFAPRVT